MSKPKDSTLRWMIENNVPLTKENYALNEFGKSFDQLGGEEASMVPIDDEDCEE